MKRDIKKIFAVFLFASLLMGVVSSRVHAETTNVEKALQNVQTHVDDLVNAKDDSNQNNDVGLRIETFKKVLDFSVAETKDLKVKLLSIDTGSSTTLITWQKTMLDALNQALAYYETEGNLFTNTNSMDMGIIKSIGENFKSWREKTYLPVANQINDFLLVQQETSAVQTAQNRWKKIKEDLIKLQKTKIKKDALKNLDDMLQKAAGFINGSEALNKKANSLVGTMYLSLHIEDSSPDTSNTSSTVPEATTTILGTKNNNTTSTEASSTTDTNASSTVAITRLAPTSPPSIKGLVEDSLDNLKSAYQVFIEMSSFVRKLLS